MMLDHPGKRCSELIQSCVHVSDEHKKQLIKDWEASYMSHGLPLPGCAACGIRDLNLEYSSRKVSELSDCFKLNDERCEELRLLGADGSHGVGLYTSDGGVARGVDIF